MQISNFFKRKISKIKRIYNDDLRIDLKDNIKKIKVFVSENKLFKNIYRLTKFNYFSYEINEINRDKKDLLLTRKK